MLSFMTLFVHLNFFNSKSLQNDTMQFLDNFAKSISEKNQLRIDKEQRYQNIYNCLFFLTSQIKYPFLPKFNNDDT